MVLEVVEGNIVIVVATVALVTVVIMVLEVKLRERDKPRDQFIDCGGNIQSAVSSTNHN